MQTRAIERPSEALKQRRAEDEDDDDMDGEIGMVNAKAGGIRSGARTGNGNQSDDSDFDL